MFPIRTAPADQAVPPGRLGYDLTAETYLLHTVQDAVVLEALQTGGDWRPDPAKGDADFAKAYEWLYAEMARRIGSNNPGAVWFWAKTTRAALVDQCRVAARSDEPSVLLTCRIPRDRLLLSHFFDWHCVLNRSINVPQLPGESDDEWTARWEPMFDAFHDALDSAGIAKREVPLATWPESLRRQIEDSWVTIFDSAAYLALGGTPRLWPSVWQATASHLLATDVVEAVRIEPATVRRPRSP